MVVPRLGHDVGQRPRSVQAQQAEARYPERAHRLAGGESRDTAGLWHVYILRCGNGDLYTGVTQSLERRIREHRLGIGGRFTKLARPVELAHSEGWATEAGARARERQIKTWSRAKKLALIAGDPGALKSA